MDKKTMIENLVRDAHEKGGFSGTWLYAEKGEIVSKGAIGVNDIEKGTPITEDMVFDLASVTKQFTAAAVLMLRRKGLLSLDDEITKFFPELPFPGVTIRHLLTHTGGLPDYEEWITKTAAAEGTIPGTTGYGTYDSPIVADTFAELKAASLPVGIGAEDVSTVKFCAESGVVPDSWVLAFHSLDYPAARMETKCNNIWCVDPKAAADYMKTRKEPWVAVRGLAGGAIDPMKAYKFAKDNGAAAVAIDLLDYRIVETVNGIVSPPPPKTDAKGGKK